MPFVFTCTPKILMFTSNKQTLYPINHKAPLSSLSTPENRTSFFDDQQRKNHLQRDSKINKQALQKHIGHVVIRSRKLTLRIPLYVEHTSRCRLNLIPKLDRVSAWINS